MDLYEKIIDMYVKLIVSPLSLLSERKKNIFLSHIAQKTAPYVTVPIGAKSLQFYCPSVLAAFRARTLLTKEPETIDWINTFQKGDVFFDIGANVGCYTLYACLQGVTTYSFEPSAFNYFVLNENIRINGFDKLATAYCIAFSDKTGTGVLNMADPCIGSALSLFGDACSGFNVAEQQIKVDFRQGMVGYSMDDFVASFSVDMPAHVKIDVDGIEDKIVSGAKTIFSNECVRSVLIEVDEGDQAMQEVITKEMLHAGFSVSHKGDPSYLKGSKFETITNIIYVRK